MTALPTVWARIRSGARIFDPALTAILLLLILLSLITMHSAAYDFPGRFEGHVRNLAVAVALLWIMALVPPALLMRVALPLYLFGVALLIGVALFGDVSKGARRWLNLGFGRVQPSELLKIAVPLMLAWYFQRREGGRHWADFLLATVALAVPVGLIARQPDLGTALLVLAAGGFVIFLAGLNWRVIAGLAALGAAAAPLIWPLLHDYQRQRVLTLLDPSSDPLGKGFHIIQSTIAVGSGGFWGKGYMEGTQTHLEFIPERTTDFIFAVFSEEFGLAGNAVLIALYLLLIGRGLAIASGAGTVFGQLLAGAITLMLFTYAFVNMGMVSGILPVVGVPLPFMSYGGTAMVTLGMGIGMLMSIHRHRKAPGTRGR
ncbi:MAG: rod shape-determining protein RodA [Betaproteobacteria bacterium]|nr:rod shape-determining protein RodA [Betaproteobacteria bacterium]